MRSPWYMQSTGHSSMHALSLTSTQGSAITYAITISFLSCYQDGQRGMFAGSESAVRDAQELLEGRQLDAGTPVRLAGRTLKAVDGLPVRGGDELWLARGQPVGELIGMVGAEIRQPRRVSSGGQISDQGVDGVVGVFFVGADHSGRSALDPADDVLVAAACDPAGGVGDGPAVVVERQGRGWQPR